jgi:hypothetical protein
MSPGQWLEFWMGRWCGGREDMDGEQWNEEEAPEAEREGRFELIWSVRSRESICKKILLFVVRNKFILFQFKIILNQFI